MSKKSKTNGGSIFENEKRGYLRRFGGRKGMGENDVLINVKPENHKDKDQLYNYPLKACFI